MSKAQEKGLNTVSHDDDAKEVYRKKRNSRPDPYIESRTHHNGGSAGWMYAHILFTRNVPLSRTQAYDLSCMDLMIPFPHP